MPEYSGQTRKDAYRELVKHPAFWTLILVLTCVLGYAAWYGSSEPQPASPEVRQP